VNRASVVVDREVVGEIGRGLCVFVGVTHSDDGAVASKLAERVWRLRVFDDAPSENPRLSYAVAWQIALNYIY